LGNTPSVRTQGDAAQTQARDFSLSFNEELATQLGTVSAQYPTADIYQFDTYSFLNGVIENPAASDFINVQDSCLALGCDDPGNPASPDSYGFLYWDDFHPTTHGHAVIASAFVSAVPEPGVLAMFISGLFVLGIVGKRRRELAQPCHVVEQAA
jgi:phospholipase/lecithinase/hemolysin